MTTHNTTSINYTYKGVGPGVLGVSVAAVNVFGKSSPSKLNITILDCGTVTATPTSTSSGWYTNRPLLLLMYIFIVRYCIIL